MKIVLCVIPAHGATAVDRPPEPSTDTASSKSAIVHVLVTLKREKNYTPVVEMFRQRASPPSKPGDIDSAAEVLSLPLGPHRRDEQAAAVVGALRA